MAQTGDEPPCFICSHGRFRDEKEFVPLEAIEGASIKLLRENPTVAIGRGKAGSMEPAHHHTVGIDVVVMKGKLTLWNMEKGTKYELETGDYIFIPAKDLHRLKYHEDTELFTRWDGQWDVIINEDAEAAFDGEKDDVA